MQGDTLGLADDDLVDQLCDEYESSLRNGSCPSLDETLSLTPSRLRHRVLRELLLLEAAYTPTPRDTPSSAFFLSKYPQHASLIGEVDLSERVEASGSPGSRRTQDETPPIVGRYEVLGLLGQGGMGQVWKARDPELERVVAIKVPLVKDLTNDQRKRFLQEGRTSALLRHPNIVGVFDVSHDASCPYIVSSFIDGVGLGRYAKDRQLATDDVVDLLVLVADAIEAAHAEGVIHRDIKPANVLVDRQGVPFVSDFGLATCRSSGQTETNGGELLGTPAYMSPEAASGNGSSADERTDVYSLGVMLYELITGELPFAREDHALTLLAILSEDPRPPRRIKKSISRDLETVCLKALEKSPARRYQSAGDFAEELRRCRRGEPIEARRTSGASKALRYMTRRPAIAASILLAAVALAATGAMLGLSAERSQIQHENARLRDLQTVRLATSPPGAQVAFVKLDPQSGHPDPEQFSRLGVSPIERRVEPGSYLVVAWTSDRFFHEVVRYVPGSDDSLSDARPQHFWRMASDEVLELEPITLWDASSCRQPRKSAVHHGGAANQPETGFEIASSPLTLSEAAAVAPFLGLQATVDKPALLGYSDALAVAERTGWRIPSLTELRRGLGNKVGSAPGAVWSSSAAVGRFDAAHGTSGYLVLGDRDDGIPTALSPNQQAHLIQARSLVPRNSSNRLKRTSLPSTQLALSPP